MAQAAIVKSGLPQTNHHHRVAIIGAGVFGTYHARKLIGKPNIELVAIVDNDLAKAQQLADEVGCAALIDLDDLFLLGPDAVHIASPAKAHGQQLAKCIERGIHCYVEKPMTINALEAEKLARMAHKSGVKIHVGHQERYAAQAMGLFATAVKPEAIRAIRVGPPTGLRNRDVSVIWDLMIHDLDLVMKLMDSDVVSAKTSALYAEDGVLDEVETRIELSCGKSALLVASRIAAERGRVMSLRYPTGGVDIDYVNREVTGADIIGLQTNLDQINSDPLQLSVDEFYYAIEENCETSICGLVGSRAVRAAQIIEKSCKQNAFAAK